MAMISKKIQEALIQPDLMWKPLSRLYTPIISWPKQFRIFSEEGTAAETCVIINGLPKAGTHLLHRIVECLKRWHALPVHLNDRSVDYIKASGAWKARRCLSHHAVKRLKNGQLVGAHMRRSQKLVDALNSITSDRKTKHLFIYRDPRDTLVSMINFVTYSDKNLTTAVGKRTRKFMKERFNTDQERLLWLIKARQHWDYAGFQGWLKDKNCFCVRFEDLYPDCLACANGTFGSTIKKIFEYLQEGIGAYDPRSFYKQVYGISRTAHNSTKDKIGQYKQLFRREHYELMKSPQFIKAITGFGYSLTD